MAAALFRRGAGLCVRCIHRELCRVVWRPQTAMFSSKPSDRKQPRRTHIKKAKPQPALDVAKLLEQLFSQHRPSTAPSAGKARSIKTSSTPAKPPTTSSVKVSTPNVPPLLKTEPAVSVFSAASSFKVDTTSTLNTPPQSHKLKPASPTNQETLYSSETLQQSPLPFTQGFTLDSVSNETVPPTSETPASLGSEAAATEWQTSSEKIETNTETTTDPNPVELKTATELPLSAQVVENVETSSFSAATVEPSIETTRDSPEEVSHFPVETLESRAPVVVAPVEPTIDVTVDTATETKSTNSGEVDISHTATVEPLLEATVEPSTEASTSPLEALEGGAAVADCPVESTADAAAEAPAQAVKNDSKDSGPVNFSHIAEEQLFIETTTDASVETSSSRVETLENGDAVAEGPVETEADAAAQAVQTNSTDSGVVNISLSPKEEPLIETTVESALEASTSRLETIAAVSEGTAEPTIENEATENMQESVPLPLKNVVESTIESTVESPSGNVAVEDGVNKSEQMTLESVTLHVVEVMVESLKTEELLRTKLVLDGKAENQFQELLDQAQNEADYKAAAEPENSTEDESEVLTEALSKWDSLSEDLEDLEGESGMLVKELLCHVPTVVPKTPGTVETSSASNPPAGADGESMQMEEKGTEAEALTLESITLSEVKAEVGDLETEVLLETRHALEKEADVVAKEEKMEVKTTEEDVVVVEDSTEAEISTLDSISEATDAIEAETSLMLEAMLGSEQGLRPPTDMSLMDQKLMQQDEAIDQEAEKESGEQEVSVMEAMTLESVTLAEVEATLGTLENKSLSETTDYLEREAEILAGEKRMEVEDGAEVKETIEALNNESLSLPEDDALSEDLQTDALMEELLFCVPGHVSRVTKGQVGQEAERKNSLDATVAAESVDADPEAAVTDDFPASPAMKEVLLEHEEQGEEGQTEASGNEEDKGTHRDLDPVQRLFLEKIREYRNMCRLNGGPLEAEPDYEKYLSEETAKLQRLYGGGDLSSFPEFTFTEPEMDQDSK